MQCICYHGISCKILCQGRFHFHIFARSVTGWTWTCKAPKSTCVGHIWTCLRHALIKFGDLDWKCFDPKMVLRLRAEALHGVAIVWRIVRDLSTVNTFKSQKWLFQGGRHWKAAKPQRPSLKISTCSLPRSKISGNLWKPVVLTIDAERSCMWNGFKSATALSALALCNAAA